MIDNLNPTPLRNVRLGGPLGKLYGKNHKFAVKDPLEAIRALKANFNDFEKYMNTSKMRGLTYAIFSGKRNLKVDELEMDKGRGDIYIIPVIIGSKRGGLFQTILGAVLITAATIATGGFAGFAAGGAWGIVGGIGASMAIGGAIQMLSPQQSGLAMRQSPDNKPSYAFGGPVNSTAQGNPVGVLYGKRRIGGAVISAGIYAEDQM